MEHRGRTDCPHDASVVAAEEARPWAVPAILEGQRRERAEAGLTGAEELVARHLGAGQGLRQVVPHLRTHLLDLLVAEGLLAAAERLVLDQAERLPAPVLELAEHVGVVEPDRQAGLQLRGLFLRQVIEAADHARQRIDGVGEDLEALRHHHSEAEACIGVLLKVRRRLRRRPVLVLGHAVSPGRSGAAQCTMPGRRRRTAAYAPTSVCSLWSTAIVVSAATAQMSSAPRDRQSRLFTWSARTTPRTGSPSGTGTSNG